MLNEGEEGAVAGILTKVSEGDTVSCKMGGNTVLRKVKEGMSMSIVAAERFLGTEARGVPTSGGDSAATILSPSSPPGSASLCPGLFRFNHVA